MIAIVNRRGSDLTDKADGVLYTSDGRDVEMSVASTGVVVNGRAAPVTASATQMCEALRDAVDGLPAEQLAPLTIERAVALVVQDARVGTARKQP